jgi:predicted Kef-type K+ transport protein
MFLGAAVVVVPLTKRLDLSLVLGCLGTGVLIGRPGFGIIGNAREVLHVAEIGVARLLFVIGLELRSRRTFPTTTILARATTRHHELRLREAGARFVLRDTLHSSLRLAAVFGDEAAFRKATIDIEADRRRHDVRDRGPSD